jgi:ABC-2 type transport system permease protein
MGEALSFLEAFRITTRGVFGDLGALMPAVVGVIFYCVLYPLPYLPQTVHTIPVAVVDEDASSLSRRLERNLDATQGVHVVGVTRTVAEALPYLYDGRAGGIVAIPGNFRRDVLRGDPTGVTVMGQGGLIVLDGSLLSSAAQATAATVAPELAAKVARAGVPAASLTHAAQQNPPFVKQPLFNIVEGYESYVVSASMGLIIMQLLVIGISMVTATWSEKGAWPVAPDGRLGAAAFAGMVIGFAAFVLFGALFWIGFVFWYHDLPRAGNLGGAIAFAALYAVTIAAFGVALGAWMAERERALQFVAAASIPLLFMSGFAFPVESFVEPVRWLSMLFPSTPGIRGFIALNQMGASLAEAAPQVLHLAILAAVFLACAWLAASWRARGPKPATHEMQSARTIT